MKRHLTFFCAALILSVMAFSETKTVFTHAESAMPPSPEQMTAVPRYWFKTKDNGRDGYYYNMGKETGLHYYAADADETTALPVEKTKKKRFVTAEVAAQRLYQSWRQGNRSAALRVATAEAVNKLFHEKWRPMKPGKNFCQNRGSAITCIYHDGKAGVLEMEVEGGVSVGGYSVTSVSLFSAAD